MNFDKKINFSFGDKIVIGCSTGPDSMALVDMMLKNRKKYDLELIIAHVNHNIRKESIIEEKFLEEYCNENDIIFESMTIEEYGDDNFHNEARHIRYNFFETIINKYGANYLMTAHHGDDLIETILMRIVRGSNLKGYSGFKGIVDMENYKIIRPLIYFTKKQLEDYDKKNNVKYFIDSSNEKDKYTRNRYRKYVLPFLKKEEKDVHLKFLKFSKTLNEANNFIDKLTKKAIRSCYKDNIIKIDLFLQEESFIQREILYYILSDFYQDDLILINDKHIDLLIKILKSKRSNSMINLPNNVVAIKKYSEMTLVRDVTQISGYEMEFDSYVLLPNNHSIEKTDFTTDNSNCICRLNSNDIVLPLIIRTRKIGDKMKVKGLNGTKKVKDIFIDKKISLLDRDNWPIVLDSSGRVVWIPGIKKSKFDKKINEEYDIILKYN